MTYDCIVVGGGIAGLQGALQLGRYGYQVLVIDAGHGRSTLCRSYHNVLGWPDGISGDQLRNLGKLQAARTGVLFMDEEVVAVSQWNGGFELQTKERPDENFKCYCLLLATGVMDRFPPIPNLVECLGLSVYVCPDCDGYEVKNRSTVVMGSGESGARMAIDLFSYTRQLVYVNHEQKPVPDELARSLRAKDIMHVQKSIASIVVEQEGAFKGIKLLNGEFIPGDRGFIAFGGNAVKSALAEQLGVERLENKHIITDSRTKMTSVPNVWAAGDVAVHSEQVAIAMGEGLQAAIWIHKSLEEMKQNSPK